MKIKLIFDTWRSKEGHTILWNSDLSMGEFHSGTTFNGEIELDADNEIELKEHLQNGYRPVFWVMEKR